jgi:hypothetical protein
MLRKPLFLFLIMAMLVGGFSGICFAGESSDVVYDTVYPELGLRAHSWITGYSSETIAHTQVIDLATGKVIKQLDKNCSYEAVPNSSDLPSGE